MEREIKFEQTTPGMSLSQNSRRIENELRQVECKLKHEIKNVSTCPNCSKQFSTENMAVILECGHTVCKCCYYNLKRDGRVCWKQCEPVKQGELLINHQIQDNIELLHHVDTTSTLRELGVPWNLICVGEVKHVLLPSESIIPCDQCEKEEICLRCEECNLNICLSCRKFSLTKEKCFYGHSLRYQTEKATCIGCNKEVNAIFTCQTCPTYKICYKCEGFTKFESKVCPNGKELEFIKEEKCCILCKMTGNGFYCPCCHYFLCVQSCSKPTEHNKTLSLSFTSGNLISTLTGHTSFVNSLVKFMILGKIQSSLVKLNENEIASGSLDKTIKVWNIEKKECVITLTGHTSYVESLVKLNENEIASGSWDNTIKVWNIEKKECVITLTGHFNSVLSLVKLNENEIASASDDKTIKVWNIEKKECVITLTGHTAYVWSLVKLNENEIASGSRDNTIKVWNIEKKECVITLTGHTSSVTSLVKLNENEIASGSVDKTIKVWNIEKKECVITLTGHTSSVWSLVKLNENEIASASDDETIKVWELIK